MSSSGCFGNATFVATYNNEASNPTPPKPNLRRTLSATVDMSSAAPPKCLVKRVQSSHHLDAVDERRGAFDDVWSSILSNKKNESGSGPDQPYVHPMVKRRASSLSEKSLEICTESLGSESGSDGLGSMDPGVQEQVVINGNVLSKNNSNSYDANADANADGDGNANANANAVETERKEYNYRRWGPPTTTPTKSMVTSATFPPPLPSLSHAHHIRTRRHDGRLVLEAVSGSAPSAARLRALRCDGRLVLTLYSDPGDLYNNYSHDHFSDDDDGDDDNHNNHDDRGNEVSLEFIMKEDSIQNCRMIISNVMMKEAQKWRPGKFNATVIKDLDEEEGETPAPALEPLVPPTTATVLNVYEYYWRRSATVAVLNPVAGKAAGVMVKGIHGNEKWILGYNTQKGVDGNLIPFLSGCKEHRKSLLLCDPYWIATS